MSANPLNQGFVYIHGAGLDTWIWEDVTQEFDIYQLAASFPGRDGKSNNHQRMGLRKYVDYVCQQIENWQVDRLIILSHSIGGVVGLEVANDLSDRVVGFVGICAAIPKPGSSFLSCYPFHQRIIQQAFIRLAGTRPPDSAIRGSLCDGLSEEHTRRIVDQFTPESRNLFTDRCNAQIPNVPTLYVKTTNDKEFGSSLQDTMIANLRPDDVAIINAGHMPMLSHPQELAGILDDFQKIATRKTE